MSNSFIRDGRRGLMMLCLAATLTVVAALGYEAVRAARDQRETVESVLRDYAELAAEQYGASAALALDYNWLFPALRQLRRDGDSFAVPAPDTVIETQGGPQRLGDLASRFVVVPGATGDLVTPEGWPAFARGNALPARLEDLARTGMAEGWPIAALVLDDSPEPRLIAYTVSGSEPNEQVLLGFEANLGSFASVLAPALRVDRVLPRSLTENRPNDDLVSVHISTPSGHTLYRSGPSFDRTFSAYTDLGPRLGNLRVETAIPTAAAGHLVIGGLPYSRLPVIGAMLLLTLGLTSAGILLWRQESELVRTRERFVAGASHELRTPLAQIRMFAETLRLDRVRSDDERQRSLEILDREARRLTYLVENLLQFSRTRGGRMRAAPERLELHGFSAEVLDTFGPLAAARKAEVRLNSRAEILALADRGMLTQVLLNLLDNATKFGPEGQTVTVSIARRDDDTVAVQVDDQGPGVPQPQREKIWHRFWRGPETDHTTGTGIGLALVKELVELQDGSVIVGAAPGGGARFEVRLQEATV